ncbi:MAG: hypothetical protein MZW92_62430 [Comamonadaceae bacterium]|nr:hypothetical protein [Comamonadaceae bacterium]
MPRRRPRTAREPRRRPAGRQSPAPHRLGRHAHAGQDRPLPARSASRGCCPGWWATTPGRSTRRWRWAPWRACSSRATGRCR